MTRLANGDDQNALAQMIDELSTGVTKNTIAGEVGRTALWYTRKFVTSLDDKGCTAIGDSPIMKCSRFGQYAEVKIEAVRPDSPLGCFGIGVTTTKPESLFNCFPKRLDRFGDSSWIFSGPYKGTTRRLYIDGETWQKFTIDKEEDKRWKAGDVVGLVIRRDGQMILYLNGHELISKHAPGLEDYAEDGDLYLVVEAFGYVLACSLPEQADPSKLDISEPQALGPLSRRLTAFLGSGGSAPRLTAFLAS